MTDNLPLWREGLRWAILREYDRRNVPPFTNPDPSVCLSFPDAKTANTRRQALVRQAKKDETGLDWAPVVFIPSYKDATDWRNREGHRLSGELPPEFDKDGKQIFYMPVPWTHDDWYYLDGRENHDDATTWASMHYAHMSRVMPGQVAFTPTEEYGVQNRKIRMTVARYLDKYAKCHDGSPALSARQIARYVAIVKAHTDQRLQIARDGADIVAVYLNGPSSCMSHAVGDYKTHGIHPVSAYGDSDLGVAYLGDPNDGVSARSIVWPDKKTYIRIYGDETLKLVLESNGYTHGSLHGATFPAIRLTGGKYLFPYIDTLSREDGMTADLITKPNGKQYFKLKTTGGEYDAKTTEGVALIAEETYTCTNCGDSIDGDAHVDQNGLCNSCYQDHWSCNRCGDDSFGDDERYSSEDGDSYCQTCYETLFARCKACGCEYDKTEDRVSKRNRGVTAYCSDCSDDRMICDTCDKMVDDDAVETACVDCREPEETETETDTETETV
jgi:hypothetical protein